jgi:hypothetical protein
MGNGTSVVMREINVPIHVKGGTGGARCARFNRAAARQPHG